MLRARLRVCALSLCYYYYYRSHKFQPFVCFHTTSKCFQRNVSLRLRTHAGLFAIRAPIYALTAAGCISHYTTLAPAIPCTVGLSEREFARSRPPTNGTEQKIDPGRGFARLKEAAKTLGLENSPWTASGSPACIMVLPCYFALGRDCS